jgi:homocysteine S-methyltransferase
MRKVAPGPDARKEGINIAREMLFAVRKQVQGAYLMPPLGKYELALEVLDGL